VDYNQLAAALDQLLDAGAADERHPLSGLASLIGDLLEAYDEAHRPMPEVTGVALLRYLMDEHGIRQTDLAEVGAQSVVSAILAGKRAINARQALALAQRFGVDVGVFLEPGNVQPSASSRPASTKRSSRSAASGGYRTKPAPRKGSPILPAFRKGTRNGGAVHVSAKAAAKSSRKAGAKRSGKTRAKRSSKSRGKRA
jgi:HTH-type transcriptional regulator/antitoxin HigA